MAFLVRVLVAAMVLASGAALVDVARAVSTPHRHIVDLAGRWAGTGTVQWQNGKSEPYKCVITYFLGDGGAHVKQNLRCRNTDSIGLDLAARMDISGELISGTWEERQSSMTGAVNGKVTATGFEATAHNQFFNARFLIAIADGCEQSVTIEPSRQIRLITATLRKC